MAHGYRTLQHWNQWLAQPFLGSDLLAAEQHILKRQLAKHFGKHALLIGVPQQQDLLNASTIPYHSLVTPLINPAKDSYYHYGIEGDFHELPILTGSVDLVMLPHTLEFVDNPRQLLSEACRVIKPEGLLVICGFNPSSWWGLKKYLSKDKTVPWSANFIHSRKVKSWLKLADFDIEGQTSAMYRPPLTHSGLYKKMHFLERIGAACFPALGGVHIIFARAKLIPLTPIKLK